MTITSRAERNSDLSNLRTTEFAAPGRYDLRKPIKHTPNFCGFGNSDTTRSKDTSSSQLPGPGAYISDPEPSFFEATNAGFKSTSARLAPTAPGSSAFMSSTIEQNPGPGRYNSVSSVDAAVKNGTRAEEIKKGMRKSKSVNSIMSEVRKARNFFFNFFY